MHMYVLNISTVTDRNRITISYILLSNGRDHSLDVLENICGRYCAVHQQMLL